MKRVSMVLLAVVMTALVVGISPAVSQLTDNPGDTGGNQPPLTDIAIQRAAHLVSITNRWLMYYGDRSEKTRKRFERVAITIARMRRPAMRYLIDQVPEKALQLALGKAQRNNLTTRITKHLESQIDTTGDVYQIAGIHEFDQQRMPLPDPESSVLLSIAGQDFVNPSVYGRRIGQPSKEGLPVHGIALGEHFAWSADPFRWLDSLEKIENKVPVESDALFVGDTVVTINDPKEFFELQSFLFDRETFPGPVLVDELPTTEDEVAALDAAWTNGAKTILWVPVDLASAPGSVFTRGPDSEWTIARADEWIRAASRDRTNITVEYFPDILRLPADTQSFFDRGRGRLFGLAARAMSEYDRTHGATGRWEWTSWDRIVFLIGDVLLKNPRDPVNPIAAGAFSSGARMMMFYGMRPRFFLHHELGHTYMMRHSFYSQPQTDDLAGPGIADNMLYDIMGRVLPGGFPSTDEATRAHPSAGQKFYSFWLEDSEVIDATLGGSFRIVSHDRGPAGFVRALKIRTSDTREYWVDMRRLWESVPAFQNGVQIYFHDAPPMFAGPGIWYFAGPRALAPIFDSPFQVGDVFTDASRGVRITVDNTGLSPFALGVFFADITVERF
jgi:hypothetical protein